MVRRLRLLAVLTFILALVVVPAASAAPNGPIVTLSADQAAFTTAEPVIVHVSITNPTDRNERVLRWHTPADGVEEPLFSVVRDGQPVPYVGPLFKRPPATGQDFVKLGAGETATYDVDLSASYDLSVTGSYVVVYNIGRLTSEPLTLFVEGRTSGPTAEAAPEAVAGSTSFNKCSTTQQSTLLIARTNADKISTEASSYLGSNQTGARYTTWFGAVTTARYDTVTAHFTKITDAMQNASVTFDCGCKKKYYAYVYPNQPYKIYLCSVYWSAPAMGTDSQAGTLVHEMSHFYVVASTDDYVYGQSGAKSLAISNPANAVDNADNHEYFAENTPALN